jgi:hypothetical protein
MQKLKSKVEICKLQSMTLVFLPRYREACKLSPSPRWSPSRGIHRKGQAPGRGNFVDSPGPSTHTSGSPVCHPASLFRSAHGCLHYQASSRTTAGLVPFGTRWRPHHKRGWCDLTRLQAPPMYNNGARKHRVVRGVQTSLNTKPKPRASA